jgi:hypothetical protein
LEEIHTSPPGISSVDEGDTSAGLGFDPVMIQALRDIGAQTGIQVQIIEGEGVE